MSWGFLVWLGPSSAVGGTGLILQQWCPVPPQVAVSRGALERLCPLQKS